MVVYHFTIVVMGYFLFLPYQLVGREYYFNTCHIPGLLFNAIDHYVAFSSMAGMYSMPVYYAVLCLYDRASHGEH